jgi:hypothetical protein
MGGYQPDHADIDVDRGYHRSVRLGSGFELTYRVGGHDSKWSRMPALGSCAAALVRQRHVTKSYGTTLQPMTFDRFRIALLLRNLDQPAALQDLHMAYLDGDA